MHLSHGTKAVQNVIEASLYHPFRHTSICVPDNGGNPSPPNCLRLSVRGSGVIFITRFTHTGFSLSPAHCDFETRVTVSVFAFSDIICIILQKSIRLHTHDSYFTKNMRDYRVRVSAEMNRVFKAQNDAFQISRFPKNKEVSMPKVSAYFTLDRIAGKHQVKELKKQLDTLGGIFSVSVNDQKEKVAVDYDTSGSELEHILRKIEKLGYRVLNTEVDHRTDMSQRPSS